ncbi:MAG: 5-dehydro-4-deoxy-D-glucuronate isomerase [Rikenellaceae bacterium]|jgi:4-deoxy-L-threo-5-hexosulose-uronate ketol-isomerase|nr:5-dehydro-4-deoxy-D-glucuronate isomerase [Rikenellaceae bacterium]
MKTYSEVRYSSHPADAKGYDTDRLREQYLVEQVMVPGEVHMVYSMFDRIIAGGAVPVHGDLELEPIDILRSEFFTTRRELGIINTGGPGEVVAGERTYEVNFKEALYIGRGDRKIFLRSKDKKNPAKFYFNSAPAHCSYPDKLITRKDAVVMEMGSLEGSNHRFINRMIVEQTCQTCQLQMGMTELQPGSVWNTMPAHTHDRRMEVYYYFEVPENHVVCHFMGEPNQTRHIFMKNEQAVISPQWSIHSACATNAYTFIWGMCGENLDYSDMTAAPTEELR